MKKILNIFVYLLLLYLFYVACINMGQDVVVQFGAAGILVKLGLPERAVTISLGTVIYLSMATGLIAGSCIFGSPYLAEKEKLNAYKRELEKNSVSNSESSSKVRVLEAKIATLEKALNDALGK